MVTLALFDTLLSLKNEQLMMDLILRFVVNAPHIPMAQKHKINKIQSYATAVDYFLDLAPEVMKNSNKILNDNKSLDLLAQQPASMPLPSTQSNIVSKTIGANWNHYGLHTGESLYSNYHAYLFDAHHKIKICKQTCDQWSDNYFYRSPQQKKKSKKLPNDQLVQMIKSFLSEFGAEMPPTSAGVNVTFGTDEQGNGSSGNSGKQLDSLQSIGESSGYESMKYRPDDDDECINDFQQQPKSDNQFSSTVNNTTQNLTIFKNNVQPWRISNHKDEQVIELDLSDDVFTQGTVSLGKLMRLDNLTNLENFFYLSRLGPFLTSIWSKLQTFTSNYLYVNLHLTGIISHIAHYPLPLVHSILLRPDIPTTSDIPSFYQVLKILKQQIDAELPLSEESLELIDMGRTFLIDREFKLINARKIALEALKSPNKLNSSQSSSQTMSALTSYDPFKRQDSKRKSMGNPFTNMFRRPSVASNQSQGMINFTIHNILYNIAPKIHLKDN